MKTGSRTACSIFASRSRGFFRARLNLNRNCGGMFMGQPYVGEIRMFGGSFAPAGWMFCDGALLPISEYETLFNLIGTTYGGDGQSTFALPDLRGRIPLHFGNGFTLAETGGVETVTLTVSQIPAHTHALLATSNIGTASGVTNAVVA